MARSPAPALAAEHAGGIRLGDHTQGVGIVCDVRHDDQHVHALVKGQILRGCKAHSRRCDTLNGGVVCQVNEHDRTVDCAALLEGIDKKVRLLEHEGCDMNKFKIPTKGTAI